MAPLPVLKFFFLGVRQLTKPVAKHVVARANAKRGITRKLCIGLGRISLGLSGVITEWSNNEMRRQIENNQRMMRENRNITETVHRLDSTVGKLSGESRSENKIVQDGGVNTTFSSSVVGMDLGTPHTIETSKSVNAIASATPRSRSLLEVLTYGPAPKESQAYSSRVFVNPMGLAGGVARIFIRQSYQSAWVVFRTTFFSPFPEERLLSAGVDLMIELLAYIVLASLLFWELSIQSKANAAKEARIDEMESKLNRLIDLMHLDYQSEIMKTTPTPAPKNNTMLNALMNTIAQSAHVAWKALRELLGFNYGGKFLQGEENSGAAKNI
ncbi:unnamed protein product [Phytomonas sp. EM1]|nr:unnamed protein product [Phytomonas sp. EM1]|eukprot:CCW60434.1 unnamed protein product [Phytomonas sp. isolate EM1]